MDDDFDLEWAPKHSEMLAMLEGLDDRDGDRLDQSPVVAGEVDAGEAELGHQDSRGAPPEFLSPLGAWKKMQESGWTRPADAGAEMGMALEGSDIAPPRAESVAGRAEDPAVMNEAANTLQRGAEKLYEVFSNHVTIAIVGAGG